MESSVSLVTSLVFLKNKNKNKIDCFVAEKGGPMCYSETS